MSMELKTVVERFLEPLNDETKKLLRPIKAREHEMIELQLDDTGKSFIIDCYSMLDGEKTYSGYTHRTLINRIPQRKIRKDVEKYSTIRYELAGTDFTALIIHSCWPQANIVFHDDAFVLYTFLLTRFLRQTECAKTYAEYKIQNKLPVAPEDFYDHPELPLMSFQQTAVSAQTGLEGANLWMEQGTGKTPIVISRINYEAHQLYKKESRMYRALIVVPKAVRLSWQNKIMQFGVYPGNVTVLKGDRLNRTKLLVDAFKIDSDAEYTIIICSYDTVQRSWPELRMVQWDFCCLDEAHMIKSPNTKRWKAMMQLRDRCTSRTGLTGTPFANTLFDIYTQLEWLGEGLSGFTTFKSFRSYYGKFLPKEGNRQFDVLEGYKNLPILQERIARLCFQVKRKEALPELPEKTYDVLEVQMTTKQREFYMKLRDQLMIEIEADMQRDTKMSKQMTATHVLTKLLRLSQITSGYVKWDAQYDDDGNLLNEGQLYEEITPNPKIDALIDFIKNTPKHAKLIVWCNWVSALKIISREFDAAGINHVMFYGGTSDKKRDAAVEAYNNDPNVKVFLGNPAAGGVGLDLWGYPADKDPDADHGCNTEYQIYYSQNWSMIHRSQSEDRSTRKGTRVAVQIIDLIVPGTIDQEIAQRVLKKQMNALELQDVREVMKRILEAMPAGDNDG